jgi:uncharacterized DUF497 family protein
VEFEWDKAKREKVQRERGIDFRVLAETLFGGQPVVTKVSPRPDELRFVTIGPMDGVMYAMIWTRRDHFIRVITARRARRGEERDYRALYG